MLAAVDARHARRRSDWAGHFVRKTRCVTFTAAGRKCAVTAGEEVLGNVHNFNSLEKAWEAWNALPASQRAPGAVQVGGEGPRDPALEPPAQTLVVRTYTRQLERNPDGSLRYATPEDYPVPEPPKTRSGSPRREGARFREAGHDFMWIPENEWRALISTDPKPGERGSVPETFKLRILRYHLDPERGLGEAQWFTRAAPEDGTLEWIVEDVSDKQLRLRLEGEATLRPESNDRPTTAYTPALLGYLSYDRKNDVIESFKMIALGAVLNTPRGVRPGLHPLGIAFELVRDPTAAERVVPRGGRDNLAAYLRAGQRSH